MKFRVAVGGAGCLIKNWALATFQPLQYNRSQSNIPDDYQTVATTNLRPVVSMRISCRSHH